MTVVIALAAFAICWVVLGIIAVVAHRCAGPFLAALHPRPRAALLLALALLPLVVAMLVDALAFAPAIGGWVVDEHCHPSTGCATHVPVVHADVLYAAGLVLFAAAAAGSLLWFIARRLHRSLRLATALRWLAEPSEGQPFETIESREQFAYCIGLLRPKVVVSRALVDRLSPMQLEVVLKHEQAHAIRRDNLRLWLAGLALLPLPGRIKQLFLEDLALAGEQVCDRAAIADGHHELVIETLRVFVPEARSSRHRARATFDRPTTIAARIESLRRGHTRNLPVYVVHAAIAIAYGACAVVTTDVVHHGTELLLATIS